MAHGQPDFGSYAAKVTTYGLADMGELAARLGSVVTQDRRGDVMFIETFDSSPLRWLTSTTIAGSSVELQMEYAKRGIAAVKLHTPANAGADAAIIKYWQLPSASNLGLEVSLTMDGAASYYMITSFLDDGTYLHYARLWISEALSKIAIMTTDGAYVDIITSLNTFHNARMFYAPKIVWDWKNKKYKRLIWDGIEYDISDYALYSSPIGAFPHLNVTILKKGTAGSESDNYIDEVILTQNEP